MKYASKLFVVFCLLAGLCGTIVSCAPTKKADETAPTTVEEETDITSEEAAAPVAEEAGTAETATTTEAAK
ncbi:MAG: hypothetical protein QME49_07890 [bacterium]|nr:hypothetical protein [bacterium]